MRRYHTGGDANRGVEGNHQTQVRAGGARQEEHSSGRVQSCEQQQLTTTATTVLLPDAGSMRRGSVRTTGTGFLRRPKPWHWPERALGRRVILGERLRENT